MPDFFKTLPLQAIWRESFCLFRQMFAVKLLFGQQAHGFFGFIPSSVGVLLLFLQIAENYVKNTHPVGNRVCCETSRSSHKRTLFAIPFPSQEVVGYSRCQFVGGDDV